MGVNKRLFIEVLNFYTLSNTMLSEYELEFTFRKVRNKRNFKFKQFLQSESPHCYEQNRYAELIFQRKDLIKKFVKLILVTKSK